MSRKKAAKTIKSDGTGVSRPRETVLSGTAVSRGVASGNPFLVAADVPAGENQSPPQRSAKVEIKRLRAAFETARRQLSVLAEPEKRGSGRLGYMIFASHLEILNDRNLLSDAADVITGENLSAEQAIGRVAGKYAARLKRSRDARLRENALDILDVAARVVRALGGLTPISVPAGSIVIADELSPSTALELLRAGARGICTSTGGWTSHTSIVARDAGVPAVSGVKGIHRRLKEAGTVMIDGYKGEVVFNPGPATLARLSSQKPSVSGAPSPRSRTGCRTLDGEKVRIRVNIDQPRVLREAPGTITEGIGLFRTEGLFTDVGGFPSEARQCRVYEEIVRAGGRSGAVIRTFDLNYDRAVHSVERRERNPALGLRGTRLMLLLDRQFRCQIRALLRASASGRLDILVPMVSDVEELHRVKEIIGQERTRLKAKGIRTRTVGVGAMIEVPSAVAMIGEILREVDFVSVGTNDLVQYLLGADRDNEMVASSYRTLHPAVLRALKYLIEACSSAKKTLVVCGEMAASPAYVGLLIGLGARDISVKLSALGSVRAVLGSLAAEECSELASEMLQCSTAAETEALWLRRFVDRYRSLIPDLPQAAESGPV